MKIRLVDIVGMSSEIKVNNNILLGVLSYTFKLSDIPYSVIEFISSYSDIVSIEPSKSILDRLNNKTRSKYLSFTYDNRINKLIVAYIKLIQPLLRYTTIDATSLILPALNRDCYFTISSSSVDDLLKDSFKYNNDIYVKMAAIGIYNNVPDTFKSIYYSSELEATFKEPIYDYIIADNVKVNGDSILGKIKDMITRVINKIA